MGVKKEKYAKVFESILKPNHIPFMLQCNLQAVDNVTRAYILLINQLDRIQMKYKETSTEEEREHAYLMAVRNAKLGFADFLIISVAVSYVTVACYIVRFFQ